MSFTIWFTGVPNSGKTTLGYDLYSVLKNKYNLSIEFIDGNVFRNFNKKLTFTKRDRNINTKSIATTSYYLNKNNINVIVSAIAPYEEVREENRKLLTFEENKYIEVFCKCDLEILKLRDTKGLYNNIDNIKLTGVNDTYDIPKNPDLILDTGIHNEMSCYTNLIIMLNNKKILKGII